MPENKNKPKTASLSDVGIFLGNTKRHLDSMSRDPLFMNEGAKADQDRVKRLSQSVVWIASILACSLAVGTAVKYGGDALAQFKAKTPEEELRIKLKSQKNGNRLLENIDNAVNPNADKRNFSRFAYQIKAVGESCTIPVEILTSSKITVADEHGLPVLPVSDKIPYVQETQGIEEIKDIDAVIDNLQVLDISCRLLDLQLPRKVLPSTVYLTGEQTDKIIADPKKQTPERIGADPAGHYNPADNNIYLQLEAQGGIFPSLWPHELRHAIDFNANKLTSIGNTQDHRALLGNQLFEEWKEKGYPNDSQAQLDPEFTKKLQNIGLRTYAVDATLFPPDYQKTRLLLLDKRKEKAELETKIKKSQDNLQTLSQKLNELNSQLNLATNLNANLHRTQLTEKQKEIGLKQSETSKLKTDLENLNKQIDYLNTKLETLSKIMLLSPETEAVAFEIAWTFTQGEMASKPEVQKTWNTILDIMYRDTGGKIFDSTNRSAWTQLVQKVNEAIQKKDFDTAHKLIDEYGLLGQKSKYSLEANEVPKSN